MASKPPLADDASSYYYFAPATPDGGEEPAPEATEPIE